MKIFINLYSWMIINPPHYIMYKHINIDSQHKMYLPRWRWSKTQIIVSKKQAQDLIDNIKWE